MGWILAHLVEYALHNPDIRDKMQLRKTYSNFIVIGTELVIAPIYNLSRFPVYCARYGFDPN